MSSNTKPKNRKNLEGKTAAQEFVRIKEQEGKNAALQFYETRKRTTKEYIKTNEKYSVHYKDVLFQF